MAAVLERFDRRDFRAPQSAWQVVIVGAGPVGVRMANELHRRSPATAITVLGAEAHTPYNRVRLSSALAGDTGWSAIERDMQLPQGPNTKAFFGCPVVSIDRSARTATDAMGRAYPYDTLVLATGSRPHVPDISGMQLPGVYTFRDMADAERLLSRRVRSRYTAVLGGGLLGLEAARAMRRFNTQVVVIEHADRLMSRQLDVGGGEELRRRVEAEGIEAVLSDGVVQVLGESRLAGVQLRSKRVIDCDTLVVATGIVPNIELARAAGIAVGRGIKVDDRLRTSDASIYAVGECAEHRGVVYGLVAPGLEQAAVAAHVIAGGEALYAGSVAATRLKVMRCPVFSMGEVGATGLSNMERALVYQAGETGLYRKLVLNRGRLAGAIAVGEWSELSRTQEAIGNARYLWPWQRWRFRRSGKLWPEETATSVAQWPASATVCNCTGITCGRIRQEIADGCSTVEAISARTGASTVCGSCRPLVAELVGGAGPIAPAAGAPALLWLGVAALLLFMFAAAMPSIPYPESWARAIRWDTLWRESLWKQVSGYSLLALVGLLGSLGLRKRWKRFSLGAFWGWRVIHGALGVIALAALFVHTGGRLGSGLNLMLGAGLLVLAASGAAVSSAIAREHEPKHGLFRRLRASGLWLHILALWGLPVLLAFHILKTYWY